jgi:hypothetical protein
MNYEHEADSADPDESAVDDEGVEPEPEPNEEETAENGSTETDVDKD